MEEAHEWTYRLEAIAAGGAIALGAWLPWIMNLPVGFRDRQPYYSSECHFGMEAGLTALDLLLVGGASVAVLAAGRRRVRDGRTAWVLGLIESFEQAVGYPDMEEILTTERYAVGSGIVLVLARATFLVSLGVGAVLDRRTRSAAT